MTDLTALRGALRLLIEVPLKPIQGFRFQPTGFPDLGPARYESPEGEQLLVESAQSMANRLELVCWDDAARDLVTCLKGLSYVRVVDENGNYLTSTVTESHRLAGYYVYNSSLADGTPFPRCLADCLNVPSLGEVSLRAFAKALLRYDSGALLHGVFLVPDDSDKQLKTRLGAGRLRIPRSLSAFIEASGVRVAASGGSKQDRVDPTRQEGRKDAKGPQAGTIPFARDEFTAERITAYFNLDLEQIRAYGLGAEVERLLTLLALYKIRRFLESGLRLRTACDLELAGPIQVVRPEGFVVPELGDLEAELPESIGAVAAGGLLADPPVTVARFVAPPRKKKDEDAPAADDDAAGDDGTEG